jgi:SAM-dependent methyltransferase
MPTLQCRLCDAPLTRTFVDLGLAPPCEAFVPPSNRDVGELFLPLHARVCESCLLVQLPEYLPPEQIFTADYAYYSSFSASWVEHARTYAAAMTDRLQLGPDSHVIEVASNDGYLLQHFLASGIDVLGIDPAANTAAVARSRGIATEEVFLGEESARDIVSRHPKADLLIGNNVYAHVPDLRDFTRGLAELLADDGTLTLEFPHLQRLIDERQYDTIYHEHFSYYTLRTAAAALATAGLSVVDVEELPSHGGSLRLFVMHDAAATAPTEAVERVLAAEREAGLHRVSGYDGFAQSVATVKCDLLDFLVEARRQGRTVVGYGAPGKGNTMLNHCGVRSDLLAFTVDRNHHKHGMLLPGSRIEVRPPQALDDARPDYVLVLPWNLRKEITQQLQHIREWGGRFVFAIPQLEVV